ncbi:MAG: MBOAT family protein [Clostridia bacterium]|nr:MBOAT family protein [Clostridia bacterium]
MVFSSLVFLYAFLPLLLLCYYLLSFKNLKVQNGILVIFSLLFYSFGEPIYVFVMIGLVAADYLFGLLVAKARAKTDHMRKTALVLAVIFNLSVLGFFKYTNFALSNLNAAFGLSIPLLNVVMPIGISFFTFQAMSYVIDVYRGTAKCQRSPLKLLLYVSFFPQLIAGPIVRYHDIDAQLSERTVSAAQINDGIFRFAVGLGKKILIADLCASASEALLAESDAGVMVLAKWAGVLFFMFQIYYDFSGYSDMAVGLGKLFGFTFLENFDYPYLSSSITEFWRRWHISLGTWFREYVYIPMGGNRVDRKWKLFRNLFVVWFLTGFWHGANWNFILWGLYNFLLLVLEKAFLSRWLERIPAFFRHLYSLVAILFGWAIFLFEDHTFSELGKLFGIGASGFTDVFTNSILLGNCVLLAAAALLSFPVIPAIGRRLSRSMELRPAEERIIRTVLAVLLIAFSTVRMVGSTYSPFLYFRF